MFNQSKITQLLEPFAPGMATAVTPIRYDYVTPDIFAFLFRTTGKDGLDHFFVSLEFDYLKDLDAAGQLIEQWHGAKVEFFWQPRSADKPADNEPTSLQALRAATTGPYYAVLAKVKRPKTGYWAEYIHFRPGDHFDELFDHLPAKQQAAIHLNISKLLKIDADFKTNTTDKTVIVWSKADMTTEFFF